MGTAREKPVVWLHGEVKSPPFSRKGRYEAGALLGLLQRGISLGMPHARTMPSIGAGCGELRVRDGGHNWRVVYFLDDAAVVVLEVFPKSTRTTPKPVVEACKKRLAEYLKLKGGK